MTIQPCPAGLKVSGRRLWGDVTRRYELDEHELALLREAARTVDTLDDLAKIAKRDGPVVNGPQGPRAHPAVVEARQLRIALARLFAALRLPDGDEAEGGTSGRRQRRGGTRGVYAVGHGGAA